MKSLGEVGAYQLRFDLVLSFLPAIFRTVSHERRVKDDGGDLTSTPSLLYHCGCGRSYLPYAERRTAAPGISTPAECKYFRLIYAVRRQMLIIHVVNHLQSMAVLALTAHAILHPSHPSIIPRMVIQTPPALSSNALLIFRSVSTGLCSLICSAENQLPCKPYGTL